MSFFTSSGRPRGRSIALLVAGLLAGTVLIQPAVGHVTRRLNHLYKHLDKRYVQEGEKASSAATADTANAMATTFFRRSGLIAVPAGGFQFGEIACPAGTEATGGGVAVNSPGLNPVISTPTDGTGAFVTNVGAAGAGFSGWGTVVVDEVGGGGNYRVYVICQDAKTVDGNYAAGASTYGRTAARAGW